MKKYIKTYKLFENKLSTHQIQFISDSSLSLKDVADVDVIKLFRDSAGLIEFMRGVKVNWVICIQIYDDKSIGLDQTSVEISNFISILK